MFCYKLICCGAPNYKRSYGYSPFRFAGAVGFTIVGICETHLGQSHHFRDLAQYCAPIIR
jgi:hypothetical protein